MGWGSRKNGGPQAAKYYLICAEWPVTVKEDGQEAKIMKKSANEVIDCDPAAYLLRMQNERPGFLITMVHPTSKELYELITALVVAKQTLIGGSQ
jgi:hypothetical protein